MDANTLALASLALFVVGAILFAFVAWLAVSGASRLRTETPSLRASLDALSGSLESVRLEARALNEQTVEAFQARLELVDAKSAQAMDTAQSARRIAGRRQTKKEREAAGADDAPVAAEPAAPRFVAGAVGMGGFQPGPDVGANGTGTGEILSVE